ncbi:MAG: lipoprotein signal peptidase [Sphingobacteriales bacterium]|nr:MAG: lipoprotein signal peptidase [Sphingobacteriales bacterium]
MRRVKYRYALILILLVLVIDQATKIYIKTHFYYGEEVNYIGTWARLHFLENEGMAFGLKISNTPIGKLVLTLFRLAAVVFGFVLIRRFVRRGYSKGLIVCSALILAGALGNLIDSMFYGLIFTESSFHVARMVPFGQGYGKFLYGRVVDMFYFPMVDASIPAGWPLVGGKRIAFFEPVFNVADAAISIGVIVLLLFQKRFMPSTFNTAPPPSPVDVVE